VSENFEPYMDWGAIDQEMSDDFHAAMVEQLRARAAFEAENTPANAAALLKATVEVSEVGDRISRTIWTLPMMVHVAGEKRVEECPDCDDRHERVVQRCSRCGSMLQMWHDSILVMTERGPAPMPEESIPWWDVGSNIAKSNDDEMGTMSMYEIKDREFDKHEMICPDLSALSE
jgi:hypothetical protein